MKQIVAVPATLALVYRAWSRKSLTTLGIIVATLTAAIHAIHPWSVFFALLVTFFLSGTAVTKVLILLLLGVWPCYQILYSKDFIYLRRSSYSGETRCQDPPNSVGHWLSHRRRRKDPYSSPSKLTYCFDIDIISCSAHE